MIDEEITAILKEVEEQELEGEEMEKESKDALIIAANNICYLKRYYDAMNDKLIVFPSVAKTIVDYSLMEEAEKHYWEEEDEFPLEYSAALRSIATDKFEEEEGSDEGGHDDEMMDRLSMALVLTQDEEDELKKAMEEAEADDEEAAKEEPVTPKDPEATDNAEPHVLLLVSKTTVGNREQLANQDLVATMLTSHGIEPVLLDGADPNNKERRNELFGISGIRAKYPQVFAVQNEDTKFIGDFDIIQMYNETGQLTKNHLLSSSPDEPAPFEEEEPVLVEAVEAFKPHLLLLISKLSTNPEQVRNQEMLQTMVQTSDLDNPEILDGADLMNKDRRNQLFAISGLRAKYPQLFSVTSSDADPTFLGDFDTIQGLNECGQLNKSHLLGIQDEVSTDAAVGKAEPPLVVEEETTKENAAPIVNSRELPLEEESEAAPLTAVPAKENKDGPQFLLLISNLSGNRQQDANQALALSTLKSNGFDPMLLDGSDPEHKIRRNELFAISGIRAKYPQLFLVKGKKTEFVGDFERIQDLHEAGELNEASLVGTKKFLDSKKLLLIGAGLALVAAVLVAFVTQRNGKEENMLVDMVDASAGSTGQGIMDVGGGES